jgi:SulP family sulfate permease
MTALGSLFGSSAHLINGPTNAISLVVFGTVAGVGAGPDDPGRVGLVALLAVLVGLIQITLALLRLGGLAQRVPEAVILGFVTGGAVLVALSQVPVLLGLRPAGSETDLFLVRLWRTCRRGGPIDLRSLAVGLGTLAAVAALRWLGGRARMRLPELLLGLILVSLLVWALGPASAGGQAGRLDVADGLPAPRLPLPPSGWESQGLQIGWGALAIALVGLAEALAMARTLAARSELPLDCNRQCLAEGLANLGGGLFQALPGSGSLSRSAINYEAGAATRLSGVFSAAAVAAALWLFAPLVRFVPPAALAGVLLWTAARLVEPGRLWHCLRSSPGDAAVVLSTAFAAVCFRVELCVPVGLSTSLLCGTLWLTPVSRRSSERDRADRTVSVASR